MNKLKVLSGVLSLAVLSSASVANASSSVVGQLIANPSALVAEQQVGNQATAYIEGDSIVTGSDSSATVSLSSGNAKLTVAPNTVMSVIDADSAQFSLTQGAFSVETKAGQKVTIETQAGSFELVSETSVNAVASFQNGEFAAVSKNGLLAISSSEGVVTSIDAGEAFVYNDKGAESVNVQIQTAAGGSTAAPVAAAAATAVVIAVATVVVAEEISDGEDASPID